MNKTLVLTLASITLPAVAASGAESQRPLSADLFSKTSLQPSPNTIFLNDVHYAASGTTTLALLNRDNALEPTGSMSTANCEDTAEEADLVVFGGGAVLLDGGPSRSLGNGKAISGISMRGMSFGPRGAGNPSISPAAVGSNGSFAGGGGGSGGGSAPPTNGGSGNSSPGTGNTAGNPGAGGNGSSSSPPPASQPTNDTEGDSGLGAWNVVPNAEADAGGGGSNAQLEGSANAAPLPLPAPVWMALAGLTLVVSLRRRLLP